MTTNKLPEWRKSLNEAVENYQSTRAWYEENQDSPSAEQDMDAAAGEIAKLIKQYGVLIVLNLLDEIDELQERGKADSAEPVADVVAGYKEGEERTCDIRWRRFEISPLPLYAVPPKLTSDNL
ncbi:hypothetical protein CITFRE_15730 [Citrobacter freundii]|uniref:hypothetical protein n=1 Tax=Citrobacter freundii TaxID=546 RepID=UPI001015BBEE|nr:hypothetical protein [Citrobacter freundii]GCB39438.1 hypothetical protein CITFRE_15730 [Citrobacter freundii]